MKRILFATDFSNASNNAFNYVKGLVANTDIIVDCIYVYDIPISYSTQTPSRAVQGYLKELKESAKGRLQSVANQLPEANRGKMVPVYGMYPSIEIDETAESRKSDLIVMALREEYGLLERFMGTTTAKTIHKSEIPVMAIPFNAKYQPVTNILFPTAISQQSELSERERYAIEWLKSLSVFLSSPEIELLHVIEDRTLDDIDITFINMATEGMKLTHSHAQTVEEGILEYMERKKPQLLAFYKPHRGFWERLYRPSKTRQLLYDSHLPLIVFG